MREELARELAEKMIAELKEGFDLLTHLMINKKLTKQNLMMLSIIIKHYLIVERVMDKDLFEKVEKMTFEGLETQRK